MPVCDVQNLAGALLSRQQERRRGSGFFSPGFESPGAANQSERSNNYNPTNFHILTINAPSLYTTHKS
jgi:hypothetical protein